MTTASTGPLRGKVQWPPSALQSSRDSMRGNWFGKAFAGERVPTFAAAAAACRRLGLWANVEIKPCPGRELETGAVVARESMRLWAGDPKPPLLSSFSAHALAAAQATAPLLPRGLLVVDPPEDWRALLAGLGCVALHLQHGRATPELAAAIHAAGYGLLCYTVNDPDRAALLTALGIDCIVTDRLDLFDPRKRSLCASLCRSARSTPAPTPRPGKRAGTPTARRAAARTRSARRSRSSRLKCRR